MSEKELKLLRAMLRNGDGIYTSDVDKSTSEAVRLLDTRGYIERVGMFNDAKWHVTEAGRVACEDALSQASERRWTRGLAIVAIVISLAALGLELDDRGYLDFLKTSRTEAPAEAPAPPTRSPAPTAKG